MKLSALIASLVSVCAAARLENAYLPPHGAAGVGGFYAGYRPAGPFVPIVGYENRNFGDGTYRYSYATGDGTAAHERGTGGVGAEGAFSYTGDDGRRYSVTYTADENGFHPQGAHLPTPPPIPPEILESLRRNAAEEARGVYNDGGYRGEGAYASAGTFHGGYRY